MCFLKNFFLGFILFFPFYLSSGTWTDGAVNDNWSDAGNWNGGVPNGQSDIATFPTIGGPQTVVVDQQIILKEMSFISSDNYTINGPETLNFDGKTRLTVDASNTGLHNINANVPNLANIYNNSAVPITISGTISGPNTLFINAGFVILAGSNTFNNVTNISSGSTLQINEPDSIKSDKGLVANGTLILMSGLSGPAACSSLTGSGTIDLNNNTLSIRSGNFPGTIMETAGPGSINKANYSGFTELLTLSGTNTYTGPTTIQGGILNVTGSIVSPVTVNAGAVLKGTGSVGITTNSGTVSPGTSIGTLTVNGDYTQSASGDLTIEISDDGSSDLLSITGNASLAGTLTLNPEPGIYPAGSVFTFMNYGSHGGALTLIDTSSLDFSAFFLGTSAFLINGLHGAILPVPIRSLSGNARQVAEYLFCQDFLPNNPDLLRVMAALVRVPADQFAKDLEKLSPAQFGALPLTNLQSNRIIADVIVENTEKFYWCDPCESQQECQANQTSVWVAPIGYYYDQHGIQGQVGFDSYAVGVGVGASHLFLNAFHVGGGAGYTYSKIDWDKDRGDGNMNSVYLGPSIGWSPKNGFLNLLIMGSYNYYDVDRKIKFPRVNRTATNNHHSYDVLARLDGGYKFRFNTGGNLDHIYILPEARVSYLNIFEEGYSESGADSINLSVNSKYSAFLQPNVLVKFLRDFHTQNWCIMPVFQIGWISNIWLSSSNYKSRFYKQEVCQPHFVVKSYSRNTNQVSLGLDVNFRRTNDWIVDVGYRVDFLDGSYVMDGKIKVEKRF